MLLRDTYYLCAPCHICVCVFVCTCEPYSHLQQGVDAIYGLGDASVFKDARDVSGRGYVHLQMALLQ